MKKIFLFTTTLFAFNFSFGQTLDPQVISSAGTSFSTGTSQLDWTIGETVTSAFSGSNMLTEGFHQPNLLVTAINDIKTDYSVNVFPNPTIDQINLNFQYLKEILTIELFDAEGRILESKQTTASDALQINMNTYAAGTYLLSIKGTNTSPKTFKIVKSN